MSAAAPRAHLTLAEPPSTRFCDAGNAPAAGPDAGLPLRGTVERTQLRRFRARPKHRLPCEP